MPDDFQLALDGLKDAQGNESELWRPVPRCASGAGRLDLDTRRIPGTETIAASDRQAARIDELQFDLGEGPCWDAVADAHPVFEPNIRNEPRRNWPAFSQAIRGENVGALFAFPLVFGPLRLGAVDLYASAPATLTGLDTRRTEALATEASRIVLLRALRLAGDRDPALDVTRFSRRVIHQATGMVIAQLDVSADDAHLLIQAHAFASDRPMSEIASDIIERRLTFAHDDTGIQNAETETDDE